LLFLMLWLLLLLLRLRLLPLLLLRLLLLLLGRRRCRDWAEPVSDLVRFHRMLLRPLAILWPAGGAVQLAEQEVRLAGSEQRCGGADRRHRAATHLRRLLQVRDRCSGAGGAGADVDLAED
jgi:hypothetical protein